jgi:D-glycero-beta-D-manno-heptose-7-phosphate kinase
MKNWLKPSIESNWPSVFCLNLLHFMSNTLDALFSRMTGKRVLVIGDVMADAYIRGKVERISPEAPVPVLNTRSYEIRLGGAANVALNLRSLGAEVTVCCLVGDDAHAKKLEELFAGDGISTRGLVRSSLRPTTLKTRIIAGGQHLLRIDEEDDRPAFPEEQQALLETVLPLVDQADAVIFEDYDKGVVFDQLVSEVVKAGQARKIPIAVDPKKRNFLAYRGVQLFKPNLKEMREGLQIQVNPRDLADVERACREAKAALGADGILLTLSEYGMALLTEKGFRHTPALPRDIADVSGAGDTVISVATLCLAAGSSDAELLQLANLAGGLVCEYSGVVPIKKEELKAEAERLGH